MLYSDYPMRKAVTLLKIVVLDGYTENPGDLRWDALEKFGTLTVYDRTDRDDAAIISRIGDAQIVITNKTPITEKVMASCPSIQLISVLATGFDVVDISAAKAHHITVCNVPAYGTATVSQYAIALLLEICHHIGHHSQTVFDGRWAKSNDWCYWDMPSIELDGKTMGIIGFGRIGQQEAGIARALGMHVLAVDPHPCDAGRALADYVSMEELLARSDVISLHCNLTAENAGMINCRTIAQMKDGAILINNARGQLINEQDLADALNSGKLRGAGLDVVSTEPIRENNPLLQAKNCIITPHISWASLECRQRIMDMTAENIAAFLADTPIHVVS